MATVLASTDLLRYNLPIRGLAGAPNRFAKCLDISHTRSLQISRAAMLRNPSRWSTPGVLALVEMPSVATRRRDLATMFPACEQSQSALALPADWSDKHESPASTQSRRQHTSPPCHMCLLRPKCRRQAPSSEAAGARAVRAHLGVARSPRCWSSRGELGAALKAKFLQHISFLRICVGTSRASDDRANLDSGRAQ